MRGETTFVGDQKIAQLEALRFILDIAMRAKSEHDSFDIAGILFQRNGNSTDLRVLFDTSQKIFNLLYSRSAGYNDIHTLDLITCCYSTVIFVDNESRLAGTITWFSTKQSGAFVRVVFGAKTTFVIYDIGYITDEFGLLTDRVSSTLLGLPRKGDTVSDKDRANFLSYALMVSQDPKWQT